MTSPGREAFEAYCRRNLTENLHRSGEEYDDGTVQVAWQFWQASLASRDAAAVRLVEAVERVILTAVPATKREGAEDVVVGYSHKTGAMHALLTAAREAGSSASFAHPTPAPTCETCPSCHRTVENPARYIRDGYEEPCRDDFHNARLR